MKGTTVYNLVLLLNGFLLTVAYGSGKAEKSINMLGYCKAPYILEAINSDRLNKRIGLFRDEIDWKKIPETYGAEPVFNGSVVGGGPGYSEIVTSGDYTVRNYQQLQQALAKARKGQVVFVPGDVKIDFSDKETLKIPGGVTLASDRGQKGSKGALFNTSKKVSLTMLQSTGEFVRISGLRLCGPWGKLKSVPFIAIGINLLHYGSEVDNCEISAFTKAGIRVRGNRLYIHNNYFHHNCRHGLGYGIGIISGTAIIEGNRFYYNRHHVSATGRPLLGYELRYNISESYGNFDMHGYYNSGQSVGNLIGGSFWDIHHNTIHDAGMLVRGIPSTFFRVDHNLLLAKKLRNLFYMRAPDDLLTGSWIFFHCGTPWADNWFNLQLGKNAWGKERKVYDAEALKALAVKQYSHEWKEKLAKSGKQSACVHLAKFDYLLKHPELLYHENCGDGLIFPAGLKEKSYDNKTIESTVAASETLAHTLNDKMKRSVK